MDITRVFGADGKPVVVVKEQSFDTAAPLDAARGEFLRLPYDHEFPVNERYLKRNRQSVVAMSAAEISAVDAAEAAAVEAARAAEAEPDQWSRVERAMFAVLLDQLNVLRTRAGLAAVTPQQARQAIRAKLDGYNDARTVERTP